MSITGSIIGCILVLICAVAIYRIGRSEGIHVERMRLINILCAVPLDNTIPERRYGVLCAVNYIVDKLKEK